MTIEAQIAACIAETKIICRMCREMDHAGYVADIDEFYLAKERDREFIFIADNGEGGYVVGAFMKATFCRAGDFAAQPIGEFESYSEALAAFHAA